MSRFLFVKNNYQPQLSLSNLNNVSIKCPWTWQEDEDVNRLPYKIVYAQCRSSCNEWLCKPVKYHTTVLKRDGNEGKYALRK